MMIAVLYFFVVLAILPGAQWCILRSSVDMPPMIQEIIFFGAGVVALAIVRILGKGERGNAIVCFIAILGAVYAYDRFFAVWFQKWVEKQ